MERPPERPRLEWARAARHISTAYAAALCALLPLALRNGYFDVTETKHAVFLALSLAYLAALAVTRVWLAPGARVRSRRLRPGAAQWCALAFLLCALVTSAIGGFSGEALFAPHGRYQGLVSAALYMATLLCLSRTGANLRAVEAAFVSGAGIVSLLAALNHFGADPLGLMVNLAPRDGGRFLSTIGNVNFYAAYICLALPVTVGLFCRARRPLERALCTAAMLAVSLGALASGSESAALGLAASALAFPALLMRDARSLSRCALAAAIFALAAFLFGLLWARFPAATNASYFFRLLTRAPVALCLMLCFIALFLTLRRADEARLARRRRLYALACGALMLLCALAVALLNTALDSVPLGPLERFLRWGEGWGTDRGRIWAYCAGLYASFPPLGRVFGGGPGALFAADRIAPLFADAALDSAHNEYLQYLLAFGAAGLISYLALLAACLEAGLRAQARRPLTYGFAAAVIAYAAQAAVNIAQPATTPLLFLFLGLLAGAAAAPDEPANDEARGIG